MTKDNVINLFQDKIEEDNLILRDTIQSLLLTLADHNLNIYDEDLIYDMSIVVKFLRATIDRQIGVENELHEALELSRDQSMAFSVFPKDLFEE